jgi:hypothetical protein
MILNNKFHLKHNFRKQSLNNNTLVLNEIVKDEKLEV